MNKDVLSKGLTLNWHMDILDSQSIMQETILNVQQRILAVVLEEIFF